MTDTTVPVTQVDREAAASFSEWLSNAQREREGMSVFFAADSPNGVRKGVWDNHDLVQAFARHRLAAEQSRAATPAVEHAALAHTIAATIDGGLPCKMEYAVADAILALPPPVMGEVEAENAKLREALLSCVSWIEMVQRDGVSLLGEGIHAGLRKGTDAPDAGKIYDVIANSRSQAWAEAVDWALDPFFSMWGGDEAIASARATLSTEQVR